MSLEVTALLSKIIFTSEKNDFLVAEFIDSTSAKRFRAAGKITVSQKADAKQRYRLLGQWENNPRYGETFVTLYSEPTRPTEITGVAPYLANNVKGVGEVTAKKLVETLQVNSIDDLVTLCRDNQEKIFSFFGEKKRKIAEHVINAMVVDEVFRNIMIFLHEHNIPPRFAKRIYEKYGSASLTNLLENPYRLIADFRQVGFLRADAIAQKLGIPPDSPFRLEAAFVYVLEAAQEEGHCCLPRDLLVQKARELLGGKQDSLFTHDFILEQLRLIYKKNREAKKESFVIRETAVFQTADTKNTQTPAQILFYLPEVIRLEDDVAGFILSLLNAPQFLEHKEKEYRQKIDAHESSLNELFPDIPWQKLSTEQQTAVEMSMSSRFMILTGGPGCGKTFVLKAIYALQRTLNRKVALCAPTGLAAKRMTASIGEQASTLHKLLGIGRKNQDEVQNVIEEIEGKASSLDSVDVVIVDESSMLSLDLLHALLSALGTHRRLILVGDVDQLPSVGAGNCLRDILFSQKAPMVRLTRIFRQSSESPIPLAAQSIISGCKPEYSAINYNPVFSKAESFAFIHCTKHNFSEILLTFMINTIKNIYHLDPIKDCQVLVPIRKSEVGQENINKILQNYLNPPSPEKKECTLPFGTLFRENDKVIQTKNNYELDVFNGDLGYCKTILQTKEKLEVTVEFQDRLVTYEDEEVEDLQLCYAMTVHKSQGSEFPLCIIPMFGVYYTMLDRNLLYTAVTRASKSVVLLGEEWAVKKAISSQNAIKRFTWLEKLLC